MLYICIVERVQLTRLLGGLGALRARIRGRKMLVASQRRSHFPTARSRQRVINCRFEPIKGRARYVQYGDADSSHRIITRGARKSNAATGYML